VCVVKAYKGITTRDKREKYTQEKSEKDKKNLRPKVQYISHRELIFKNFLQKNDFLFNKTKRKKS